MGQQNMEVLHGHMLKGKTLFSEYRVSNRRDGGTDISEIKCIGLHGVLQ
jgi:hypothetical protein